MRICNAQHNAPAAASGKLPIRDAPRYFNLDPADPECEPRDLRGRVDLRAIPLVTIDGEDARDFDDAVYCEPMAGLRKGWRLIVAIADVSHYVKSGDALDAEAQNRVRPFFRIALGSQSVLPHETIYGAPRLNVQVVNRF